jgi:similar to stage IV sporulation protein
MKAMSRIDINKYAKSTIKIEIQSLRPERFLNLLWKEDIHVQKVTKKSITTMVMEVNFKDFNKIEECGKRTRTKIRVLNQKGALFLLLRLKKQFTLVAGIVIFAIGLYFLSTFVWTIEISTERNMPPYEIRRDLLAYGIKPGTPKKAIDVYALEEMMSRDKDNVLWVRARIEGSKLIVNIAERLTPPEIVTEDMPCDIVAQEDGEIISIFTTAGTAVVKPGDIVKRGQLLVKGIQGKEGSTYLVHAKGEVVAKTFYEHFVEIEIKGTKKERTGNKNENIYITVAGKKIYIKKSLNKFDNYDKIYNNKGLIKKERYFEIKETAFELNKEAVVEETIAEMRKTTENRLDKAARISDNKIIETDLIDNKLSIRAVFIVEQSIGVQVKME